MEEIPYYGRERGQKRGFSHFVLHVKRRRRGPEVKRPFDLYCWAELNFGQEPVFLESVLKPSYSDLCKENKVYPLFDKLAEHNDFNNK